MPCLVAVINSAVRESASAVVKSLGNESAVLKYFKIMQYLCTASTSFSITAPVLKVAGVR